jgi:hypothetical protein
MAEYCARFNGSILGVVVFRAGVVVFRAAGREDIADLDLAEGFADLAAALGLAIARAALFCVLPFFFPAFAISKLSFSALSAVL